jgi:hypothetical protein
MENIAAGLTLIIQFPDYPLTRREKRKQIGENNGERRTPVLWSRPK